MAQTEDLEEQLNDSAPDSRLAALRDLASRAGPGAGTAGVNMHFHSFFSFNALEYSPSRIAWEARKAGLYAAAVCDFDVLDGLEEFLEAGRVLGIRTAVHVETRSFLAAFSDAEINSPGEPGVTYIMGAGFPRVPAAGSEAARGLEAYRAAARSRNLDLVRRINGALPRIAVDYGADVTPLTPAGNATERHIVRAYVNKAVEVFQHPDRAARFWMEVLAAPFEDTIMLMADAAAMEERVRSRFAKKGGIGYVQPNASTFPPAEAFCGWVLSCDAIPMTTWLDGTSPGERDAARLLDAMDACGAAALNIIPDRNWNIKDPGQRAVKQARLKEIVALCDARDIPVNVGTEMNKLGLPFADDLENGALAPYRETFMRGARIMVGQTILARYARFSYAGEAAAAEFPAARERNRFFEAVGALPPLGEADNARLVEMGPARALAELRDRAKGRR